MVVFLDRTNSIFLHFLGLFLEDEEEIEEEETVEVFSGDLQQHPGRGLLADR